MKLFTINYVKEDINIGKKFIYLKGNCVTPTDHSIFIVGQIMVKKQINSWLGCEKKITT